MSGCGMRGLPAVTNHFHITLIMRACGISIADQSPRQMIALLPPCLTARRRRQRVNTPPSSPCVPPGLPSRCALRLPLPSGNLFPSLMMVFFFDTAASAESSPTHLLSFSRLQPGACGSQALARGKDTAESLVERLSDTCFQTWIDFQCPDSADAWPVLMQVLQVI